MYEISVKLDFSAAHNLRNYRGKCENLHGHNWQVEAVLGACDLDKAQMVLDFKVARGMLAEILEYFDHSYINKIPYFKKVNPTSENIAKYIYDKLKKRIKKQRVSVRRVSVWETPRSCATFSE